MPNSRNIARENIFLFIVLYPIVKNKIAEGSAKPALLEVPYVQSVAEGVTEYYRTEPNQLGRTEPSRTELSRTE